MNQRGKRRRSSEEFPSLRRFCLSVSLSPSLSLSISRGWLENSTILLSREPRADYLFNIPPRSGGRFPRVHVSAPRTRTRERVNRIGEHGMQRDAQNRRRERGVIEPCLEDERDREDDPAADRGGQIKVEESGREEEDRGRGTTVQQSFYVSIREAAINF